MPGLLWCASDTWRMTGAATSRLPRQHRPIAGTVDVVIPARDEAELLPGCLDALGWDPAVHEIVVVDDGSRDGTVDVARSRGIRVVSTPPRPEGWAGKTWALEQGTVATAARWLVSVDADVRVTAGTIAALVGAAQREGVPAAALLGTQEGMLEFEGGLSVVRRATDVRAVNRDRATYLVGQCMAIRRDALAAAGGWAAVHDSVVEDVEMGERLGRHRLWSAWDVTVASRGGAPASWRKNLWRTHGGPASLARESARLVALLGLPWLGGAVPALTVYVATALTRIGPRLAVGRRWSRSGPEALAWPWADGVFLALHAQSRRGRKDQDRVGS